MSKLLLTLAAAAALAVPSIALACAGAEHGAKGEHASCDKADCAAHKEAKADEASPSCHGGAKTAAPKQATWSKITIAELSAIPAGKVAVLDANGSETRTKFGVIPGATLLTSASGYDVAKELPADKAMKLVFYCANERCTASHTAAERALAAGHTDVQVLPDGIMGWKKAGKNTSVPRS